MDNTADFENLVPDVMLDAVEQATGLRMTGVANPLPSYINRVYEVHATDETRLIVKFYRPGRWSRTALQDEHDFVSDCAADEIPVVAPLPFGNGQTIHQHDGIFFAVFPKRAGRQLEINNDEDWLRVGRLLGRVHVVGSQREAVERTILHPDNATRKQVRLLLDGGFVTAPCRAEFTDLTARLLDRITDLFDDVERIRIHGDCHCGNLLDRPGEGIMMIDFDDMMAGPPVQDLWLLLPDHANRSRRELDLLLRGYEQFREFDDTTLRLIEPLRAMRIIYFLAWCSQQVDDFKFRSLYPEWGSNAFWQRELADLAGQLQVIDEHLGH